MNRNRIATLGLCIALALYTAGCRSSADRADRIAASVSGGLGSGEKSEASAQPGTTETSLSSNETAHATTVNASTPTFGVIYPMAHPYYEMITAAAKAAAAREGVQLLVKAPDEANLEQQIRMVETMIKQHVDGIAIDPVDRNALVPVIDKAVLAGIPVICFESDAPDSRRLDFIGVDNRDAGQRMGKLLDRLLDGKGMIIVENGMSGMTSLTERQDGLLTYLSRETEIQVLDVRYNEGKEALALSDLEEMIDAHPHFDAFVAMDAVSGPVSVLVWKASGLQRYALTFGMTPDIRQALRNGQVTAAIAQNETKWGDLIVNRLITASKKETIPTFDDVGMTELMAGDVLEK